MGWFEGFEARTHEAGEARIHARTVASERVPPDVAV